MYECDVCSTTWKHAQRMLTNLIYTAGTSLLPYGRKNTGSALRFRYLYKIEDTYIPMREAPMVANEPYDAPKPSASAARSAYV